MTLKQLKNEIQWSIMKKRKSWIFSSSHSWGFDVKIFNNKMSSEVVKLIESKVWSFKISPSSPDSL